MRNSVGVLFSPPNVIHTITNPDQVPQLLMYTSGLHHVSAQTHPSFTVEEEKRKNQIGDVCLSLINIYSFRSLFYCMY